MFSKEQHYMTIIIHCSDTVPHLITYRQIVNCTQTYRQNI